MHSLTMNWSNENKMAFTPSNISVQHGTNPTFTPSNLAGPGNCSVFVDQSGNLQPGPAGSYTWMPVAGGGSIACAYNHPATGGQTTVTVTPNGGYQVSFDGKTWSNSSITIHPTGHNITQAIYVK